MNKASESVQRKLPIQLHSQLHGELWTQVSGQLLCRLTGPFRVSAIARFDTPLYTASIKDLQHEQSE